MDFSAPIYAAAHARLRARFGERVEPWWAALPTVCDELSQRWELQLGRPVGRGNTSLVLRCQRADGLPAILKLTPERGLSAVEASALRSWAPSRRVPALWGHDSAFGALLQEFFPGQGPLADSACDASCTDIAALIGALHRAGEPVARDGIVSLADRIEFIFAYWIERHRANPEVTEVVPLARLDGARKLARRLAGDERGGVLLHGDLHPGNVLDGGRLRGLVAIDPRPCVGEAAFDVVDWVFWRATAASWSTRSQELASALGLEAARVWAWCSAFAAMRAAGRVARGVAGESDELQALLALLP